MSDICASCGRRVFATGWHMAGCSLDRPGLRDHPGWQDRNPLEEERFVSVWDEVTYITDDQEGDRQ